MFAGLLAASLPASAQVSGSTGSQGTYQQQSPDTGYDDMRADIEGHSTKDELATGAALAKQGNWNAAIPHLEVAQKKDPRNVTALIYLGFSHRMMATIAIGDAKNAEYKKALDYYQQALAIDADNKLLHEYLGKLYLLMRDYASADKEMKTLDRLCESPCAEGAALKQAIAANPAPPAEH
jgi:tetratricopeptide (TPR) repeat protein